jgi:hypothetical protein
MKAAVSFIVEARKDVEQITVALWSPADTGTAPQPGIEAPSCWNATLPEGETLLSVEVTVAISVTVSFVTGAVGEIVRCVIVATVGGGGGGGAARTAGVCGSEVADAVSPSSKVAVSCTLSVEPRSAVVGV